MGAPHSGQNLLSKVNPHTGHTRAAGFSSAAGSSFWGLEASSSAILDLDAFTASTTSFTASGISWAYSATNHSPMAL